MSSFTSPALPPRPAPVTRTSSTPPLPPPNPSVPISLATHLRQVFDQIRLDSNQVWPKFRGSRSIKGEKNKTGQNKRKRKKKKNHNKKKTSPTKFKHREASTYHPLFIVGTGCSKAEKGVSTRAQRSSAGIFNTDDASTSLKPRAGCLLSHQIVPHPHSKQPTN